MQGMAKVLLTKNPGQTCILLGFLPLTSQSGRVPTYDLLECERFNQFFAITIHSASRTHTAHLPYCRWVSCCFLLKLPPAGKLI